MTEQITETEGQLALFDTDLNVTPEAQGFDPEPLVEDEEPVIRCVYCDERVAVQPSGRVIGAFHKEITCHKSPHRTHEV